MQNHNPPTGSAPKPEDGPDASGEIGRASGDPAATMPADGATDGTTVGTTDGATDGATDGMGDQAGPEDTALTRPHGPGADAGQEEVQRLIGALIDDVHRLLTRIFDRRMARLGLTRAQWRVLTFLFRRDGMTQSALAELLEMERAPLGRLLDRLDESGWVERRSDPGDKRAKRVYRTAKIDPLLPTLKDDAAEVLSQALADVDDPTQRQLIESLTLVKANLQKADAAGVPPSGSMSGPISGPRSGPMPGGSGEGEEARQNGAPNRGSTPQG